MANKFTLKGEGVEVDYTIGANPVLPALTYKEGSFSKSFSPNEIHTDSTALGSLVSVPLVRTTDAGGKTFAFFLPEVGVPQGQTARVTTAATSEEFSGPDSFPHRPPTWKTFLMHGTAQTVIVPLEPGAPS